jgi:tetratricopeptide (TPR) repeat protein
MAGTRQSLSKFKERVMFVLQNAYKSILFLLIYATLCVKVRRKANFIFQQFTLSLFFTYSFCAYAEQSSREDLLVIDPVENESIANFQIYHRVSTTNPLAQKHFDRGLLFIFSFNYNLASEEFEKAAELDPKLAMAYWGIALSLGPNININITSENMLKAYKASQRALELSSDASPNEQAYIKALTTRYTDDLKVNVTSLALKYREAMKKVAKEYFEDLDAITLYVESIMDLNPEGYWTVDGKPTENTHEILDNLAFVLKRNPDHLGANHYNIHAWEASSTPDRALISAYRLSNLFPDSDHILHMPCHIFLLVGDYKEAIEASKRSLARNREYVKQGKLFEYDALHYIQVMARSYMLYEDFDGAYKTALEYNRIIQTEKKDRQMDATSILPLEILLFFHKWKEILQFDWKKSDNAFAEAYWHFSRAMAYTHIGDLDAAQNEKKLMLQDQQQIIKDEEIARNTTKKVIAIGELVLNAALAKARGQIQDQNEYLQKAINLQDVLKYSEPPSWYFSIRSQLGKAMLEQERYAEAVDIFETALQKMPRNGRLLFGLTLGLKGLGLSWNASWTQKEMLKALHGVSLSLTDL